MFCPKCATQNSDNAQFCRACGTNIGVVSQALTGRLAPVSSGVPEDLVDDLPRRRRRGRKQASVESGIKHVFMGVGFLVVAVCLALFGHGRNDWWYWMLIPAFTLLGGGVGEVLRAKGAQRALMQSQQTASVLSPGIPPARLEPAPRSRNTAELPPLPPASVTEGTTRHLGSEAPTQFIGETAPRQEQR